MIPGRARAATAGAGLIAVVAAVHLQQYIDFMSEVPTVGVLFLLNAAGGAGLAVALLSGDRRVRSLAALGGLGLAGGALISVLIALSSGFFGYSEPTLRLPAVIAIVSETAAIVVLGGLLIGELGARRASRAGAGAGATARSAT